MLEPAENPYLYGHTAIKSSLMDACRQNRLPHALVFSGPQGVGKTTFAYHFARWMLAGSPDQFELNPNDPLFKRIASGAHGDFFRLSKHHPESSQTSFKPMSMDHVRHFLVQLSKTALEGGWRIALIDAVNDLNRNGANALLKALEEPRPKTLLMLIHHEGERLLPTIRSRCHKVSFKALCDDDTLKVMKLGQDAEDLHLAHVMFAGGRPGMLLRLDERLRGRPYIEEFMKFLAQLNSGHSVGVIQYLKNIVSDSKKEAEFSSLDCFLWLWSCWISQLIQEIKGDVRATREIQGLTRAFLNNWTLAHITEFSSNLTECIKRIKALHLNEPASLIGQYLSFMNLRNQSSS